jgi:hypothetical protein
MGARPFHQAPARLAILLLALLCAMAVRVHAADALSELPTAAQVVQDIQGEDELDTAARRIAALERLHRVIHELAGARAYRPEYPNASEKARLDDYVQAINSLRSAALAQFPTGVVELDSPRARWTASTWAYERSPELYAELAQRYFSPGFQALHRDAMAARDALGELGKASIEDGLRGGPEDADQTWNDLSPSAQEGALTFMLLMVLVLLIATVRETRPLAIVGDAPPVLRAGFLRHRLRWLTGHIENYTRATRTTITRWEERPPGGSVIRHYTTSVTIVTETFELVYPGGRKPITTQHYERGPDGEFGLLLQQQPVAMAWVVRGLRRREQPVLFRQPDEPLDLRVQVADAHLHRLVSPARWTMVPWFLLVFAIASSFDLPGDFLQVINPTVRGIFVALLSLVLWAVVYVAIRSVRKPRFMATHMPRLRALMDAAPLSP